MSDEQDKKLTELIDRLCKKEKFLGKLIWVLVPTIIVSLSSIAVLSASIVSNKKDIEYIRESAVNKKAVLKLVDAFNAKSAAVEKLIEDPRSREAIKYFDEQMLKITDDILSWNSSIEPRGIKHER